jgi:hypothetical protein
LTIGPESVKRILELDATGLKTPVGDFTNSKYTLNSELIDLLGNLRPLIDFSMLSFFLTVITVNGSRGMVKENKIYSCGIDILIINILLYIIALFSK